MQPASGAAGRARVHRVLLGLLLISAALHLFRLDAPPYVVFDEFHFGGFVHDYCCTHTRVFDIHPPHAKLLVALPVLLRGDGQDAPFRRAVGTPYGEASPVAYRLVPALVGSLLPLVLFVLIRQLGGSPPAALVGAGILVFENALLLQTRLALLDGLLLCFTLSALAAQLAARRSRRPGRRVLWQLGSGALAGLALGSKLTGLLAAGLAAVLLGEELLRAGSWRRRGGALALGGCFLAALVVVYLGGWAVDFALLDEPGPFDAWLTPSGRFLPDLLNLHRHMIGQNLARPWAHEFQSAWWGWPTMVKPVGYLKVGRLELHFLGNPVVWWGGLALGVATLVQLLEERPRRPRPGLWIPLLGFLAAWLPFAFLDRPLFLYHFLTPLLFLLMLGILNADANGSLRWLIASRRRLALPVLAVLAGFLFVLPVTCGLETPWAPWARAFARFLAG